MPIRVLSSTEAFDNGKDSLAQWPKNSEGQAERLLPLAKPQFRASFHISRDDLIFTVGSCFARNIEKQLAIEGFDYASRHFDIPPAESDFPSDISSILNKYIVFSILNELRWALLPGTDFPDDGYVEIRNGKYIDPHLNHAVAPSSLERCKARRRYIHAYMAKAARAKVFVMTLGLAEAWYDTKTCLYLNIVPHRSARTREPERFQFHILDYNEILQGLEDIHSLLTAYGDPDFRMLVTVSPVSLNQTYSGEDVLIANTYSKSVQRAAVSAFVGRHENVDYFPSYESVTLSDRLRAWCDDQVHASDEIVRYNVLKMMAAYTVEEAETQERGDQVAAAFALMGEAKKADQAGEAGIALQTFQKAYEMAPHEGVLLLEYARFLFKHNQVVEAIRVAREATVFNSGPYSGFYFLAQYLRAAGQHEAALEAIRRARVFEPLRPGILHLHAQICSRLSLYEEGWSVFEALLWQNPGFPRFREDFLKMAEAMGNTSKAQAFIDTLPEPEEDT